MSGELPRPVRVFTPADLNSTDPTPGMNGALAFELPLLWAGQVETEPGAVSGWHHHERNESSLYVVRGVLRLEFPRLRRLPGRRSRRLRARSRLDRSPRVEPL